MVGSTYFAAHPTIALDKVVEVVNLDMIGQEYRFWWQLLPPIEPKQKAKAS